MATTAMLELKLKTDQLDRRLKKTEKSLGRMKSSAISTSKIIGAVLTGVLAKASWSMIKLASDAEETGSKFTAVFKGIEKESEIVARSFAQNFGLAETTSKRLLSSTGDLLSGFGFTRGEALKLSSEVNSLAVDLASFQNLEGGATRASEALTKALLGETESAKSLGIVIRQNSKEFKEEIKQIQKATGATEQQAKTQAIFNQILEQSKNAVGDYARTADSTANRIKRLDEVWLEFRETIGRFLIDGLEVDKILEGLTRGLFRMTQEANSVKLAVKSFFIDYIAWSRKAQVQIGGFFGSAGDAFDYWKGLVTGDDQLTKNAIKNIQTQQDERSKFIEEIEKQQKQALDREFEAWKKIEVKKGKVSKETAEKAIEDAIKKSSDEINQIAGVGDDTTTPQRRQQQFAGAFEKGSVEAYSIEKSSQGNKTERQQLDVLRKIEKKDPVQITNNGII